MAKNVFEKKKRIARFQSITDDITKGKNVDELCEFDYVSNIINNMDSNYNSLSSNCSKIHAKRKSISVDELNNNNSSKSSSSYKGSSQNQNELKRKFTVPRKFPLMEKSQKTLRQIKHNRNISKPRAHLSSLSKSPWKEPAEKVSTARKKVDSPKHASKVKNNSEICSTSLSDISLLKSKEVHNKNFKYDSCKIPKDIHNVSHKKGETSTSINFDKYSGDEHLYDTGNKMNMKGGIEKNSLSDTKTSKDSENETSDSEYERFVKKNKKGLKKKVVKKQKWSPAKKIKSVKESKRVLRKNKLEQHNSDNNDSNDDDAPLPKYSRRVNCFKKHKITQVHADIHMENSEGDSYMMDDVLTRDSSSESDAESNKTDRSQPFETKDPLQKIDSVCDTESNKTDRGQPPKTKDPLQKVDSVCDLNTGSDVILSDVSNGKTDPETSHLTTVDDVVSQSYVPDVSSPCINSSSDSGKTALNTSIPDLIDLCSDSESEMGIHSEYSSVSAKMEGNNVKDDLISLPKNNDSCYNTASKKITLTTSNQEEILPKVAQNVSNLDSEESDIEVIDILPCTPKAEYIQNVSDMLSCPNSVAISKEKSEVIKNNAASIISNTSSQVVVKTEKLQETADVKNRTDVIKTESNKYEAAYMTNICNDFDQDNLVDFNHKIVISKKCRELSDTSPKDISVDSSVLQKGLKQENESDDDIIVLDPVGNANISSFSSLKRVKTETPGVSVESLKYVKHSAHKILKMENQSQISCDIPQVIQEINSNIKSEHGGESLTTLKNKECAYPQIKNTYPIKCELKFHDTCSSSSILSSDFPGVQYEKNQECIDINNMNESHLIELYKKEFDAYQEIVQAEASVSARLKSLEVRQAERVEHIRSLVQKYIAKEKYSCANIVNKDFLKDLPPSSSIIKTDVLTTSKLDSDIKPNISKCDILKYEQPTVMLKQERESSQKHQNLPEVKSDKNQILKLLNEKCNVCGKKAMAACQRCAKVFFCSHECGVLFWNNGHKNECGK